jgi:ribosome-associated protein
MNAIPSEALAQSIAGFADSKKAEDIVLLDMRDLVSYTDFLIICAARNERQARAIVDEVRVRIKADTALVPSGSDRVGEADWILLDYLDCVLHVFTPAARDRYQLENLWRDAPRLALDFDPPEASSAASA